jgi:hypothetical protein
VYVRKYRSSADSPTRIDFGVEFIAGLNFFPETKDYALDSRRDASGPRVRA